MVQFLSFLPTKKLNLYKIVSRDAVYPNSNFIKSKLGYINFARRDRTVIKLDFDSVFHKFNKGAWLNFPLANKRFGPLFDMVNLINIKKPLPRAVPSTSFFWLFKQGKKRFFNYCVKIRKPRIKDTISTQMGRSYFFSNESFSLRKINSFRFKKSQFVFPLVFSLFKFKKRSLWLRNVDLRHRFLPYPYRPAYINLNRSYKNPYRFKDKYRAPFASTYPLRSLFPSRFYKKLFRYKKVFYQKWWLGLPGKLETRIFRYNFQKNIRDIQYWFRLKRRRSKKKLVLFKKSNNKVFNKTKPRPFSAQKVGKRLSAKATTIKKRRKKVVV